MVAVPTLVQKQMDAIRELCQRHHVSRLELFGSAAKGRFDLARSDLDFLVDFEPLTPAARANAYLGLLESLQDLFDRDVDLVEVEAITNPYFRQSVDAGRTVLYAA